MNKELVVKFWLNLRKYETVLYSFSCKNVSCSFKNKSAPSEKISTNCIQLVQPDKSCGKPKQASLAHIPTA